MKSTEERVKSIIDKMAVRKKKKAILTKTVSSVCVTAACVGIIIAIGFANLRNVDIIETVVPSNEPQPTISSDSSNAATNSNSSGAAASSSGKNNGNTSRGNVIYSKSDNVTGGMNSSGKTKHNEIGNPSSVGTTGKNTAKATKTSHINTTVPEKNFCVIRDEIHLAIAGEGTSVISKPGQPTTRDYNLRTHELFIVGDESYSKYMSLGENEEFFAEIKVNNEGLFNVIKSKIEKNEYGEIIELNGKYYYIGTKALLKNFFAFAKEDRVPVPLYALNFEIYLNFN